MALAAGGGEQLAAGLAGPRWRAGNGPRARMSAANAETRDDAMPHRTR
jgi:hypothetical protein